MFRVTLKTLPIFLIIMSSSIAFANGETTFNSICITCHASGANGAPKFQSIRDWAPIIKEGKVHVIAEAYNGIRKMPAKGGNPNLKLEEFSEAVIYMVNASGAKWEKPTEYEYLQIRNKIAKASKKRKSY
jgi:mono/diheme cytochrome c family protein